MQNDFVLSETFWTDFVNSTWNQFPVLFKRMFPQLIAGKEDVFQLMYTAGQNYRANSTLSTMNVYVNGGMRMSDLQPYLVRADEVTLQQYCERVAGLSEVQQFTFVLYGCQLYHRELWMRCRRFLRGLYEKIGLPAGHVDLDIFVGKYRRTPTGIHKDAAANFSFVVQGRKKMAFWPSEAFPKSPATADYTRYENGRIVLEAEVGDVIFWPPQYWHMAFSEEPDWSVTLNLALYLNRNALAFVNHAFAFDRNGSNLLQGFKAPSLYQPPDVPEVPQQLQKELQLYRNIIRDESLENAVYELWARRLSADGFNPVPPSLPAQDIDECDIVERSSAFPIVLVRLFNGQAIVAANGHAVWSSDFDVAAQIVHELNCSRAIQVRELIGKSDHQRTKLFACKLLSKLESFGALTVKRVHVSNQKDRSAAA